MNHISRKLNISSVSLTIISVMGTFCSRVIIFKLYLQYWFRKQEDVPNVLLKIKRFQLSLLVPKRTYLFLAIKCSHPIFPPVWQLESEAGRELPLPLQDVLVIIIAILVVVSGLPFPLESREFGEFMVLVLFLFLLSSCSCCVLVWYMFLLGSTIKKYILPLLCPRCQRTAFNIQRSSHDKPKMLEMAKPLVQQ